MRFDFFFLFLFQRKTHEFTLEIISEIVYLNEKLICSQVFVLSLIIIFVCVNAISTKRSQVKGII